MIKRKSVLVFFVVGMAAAFLFLWKSPLSAQESASGAVQSKTAAPNVPTLKSEEAPVTAEKLEKSVEKKTEGTVTGISPQGIAVEYAVDEKEGGREIWFNYAEGIKLAGIQELSELKEGDTVSVVYDETSANRRLAKEIVLIRKKPKDPVEAMEPPTEGEEQ